MHIIIYKEIYRYIVKLLQCVCVCVCMCVCVRTLAFAWVRMVHVHKCLQLNACSTQINAKFIETILHSTTPWPPEFIHKFAALFLYNTVEPHRVDTPEKWTPQ